MQVLRKMAERQVSNAIGDPALEAVKTWRALRLAMVLLVVGLAASVLYEHARTTDGCWQTSLSGYYDTPVQGVFVGALVAIGVCLVAVKGNTDWEDLLLDLAGVCAPVVAFVPIAARGTCGSVLTGAENRDSNISNNVTALLVVGALTLVVLAVLARRSRWSVGSQRPSRTAVTGFTVTVVLYVATLLVFVLARRWFIDWGHPVTATAMFTFVFLNVWLNGINLVQTHAATSRPIGAVNRYTVIGSLMAVAVVVSVLLGVLARWAYWKLVLEASLIALFAVFWLLQTAELWDRGLRSRAR